MPKAEKPKRSRPSPISSRQSLETDILATQETGKLRPLRKKVRREREEGNEREERKQQGGKEEGEEEEEEEGARKTKTISSRLSKKILSSVQEQQREEEEEEIEEEEEEREQLGRRKPTLSELIKDSSSSSSSSSRRKGPLAPLPSSHKAKDEEEDEEDDEEEGLGSAEDNRADYEALEELGEEDEKSIAMYLPSSLRQKRTLADLIAEKMEEMNAYQEAVEAKSASAPSAPSPSFLHQHLDASVISVYKDVGNYLSHYTSGKVPKAFKIIPALENWEQVLLLTSPHQWTPQAMSAATRLFSSNLNEKMAQRFYNVLLLPAVRDDISRHKKLNYHLYLACKRAIYKPLAFFRGLLLPLCQEDCQVREAVILSSILAKISIPVLHSSVALLRMTEMCKEEYRGTLCLFIKTLLNKKYSLPFKVLDCLMSFFEQFISDQRKMPLIWHQLLLVFVQRYKTELSERQVRTIKALSRRQIHPQITAEVRRELQARATLLDNVDENSMTILQLQELDKQRKLRAKERSGDAMED